VIDVDPVAGGAQLANRLDAAAQDRDLPLTLARRPVAVCSRANRNDIALHIGEHVEQAPSHVPKRAHRVDRHFSLWFPLALQNLRTED
jgi:hypothetical protein